MKLTRIAVDNPVFATMMMVALLVLRPVLLPASSASTSSPTSTSRSWWSPPNYPGASPETVETEVSRKIEEVGQCHRRHQDA